MKKFLARTPRFGEQGGNSKGHVGRLAGVGRVAGGSGKAPAMRTQGLPHPPLGAETPKGGESRD